jgi:dipeptidyl aminopeptidase/acylaminoacyl peptidase
MHEPAASLTMRRPDVSPLLDAAVRRALAKHPDDRFPSAASFAVAVGAAQAAFGSGLSALGQIVTAESREPRAQSRAVSARAALYAAGVMLAIGLVGGWALAGLSIWTPWRTAADEIVRPRIEARAGHEPAAAGELALTVVDRAGRAQRTIAANRPWTPRFSPDGRRVAYGAFGAGRSTSDLWVTDLDAGTTRRLTDDDGDSNDPQWGADGRMLAYSAAAPGGKDVLARPAGGGEARVLAARDGTQFPSDWLRDGSALLVTDQGGPNGYDILVQPTDGSAAWPYAATSANETAARASPDGRWVAYTSDESGRPEVYLDSYPRPRRRVAISEGGGLHPVWRGDGRELYYWSDGALVAVRLGASSGSVPPAVEGRTVLFRAAYQVQPNTMYDVSPDGKQFVIVRAREAW